MTPTPPDPVASPPVRASRRRPWLALAAVLGPGLLAGLSDDDPAGITTYSALGSRYGYQLLWVLVLSTIALVLFHDLASRMGVVTGQGFIGLTRERFGVRIGSIALLLLVVANVGTAAAEFAGLAAGFELLGVSRYISVPVAAFVITALVVRGDFHRVEHVLLALGTIFLTYVASAWLSHPDWGQVARGLVLPTIPAGSDAVVLVAATVGTTLAPWGLSFIQSYAVDKRLTTDQLADERVDVVIGSALTGLIGACVIVACAATLFQAGRSFDSAADAAAALEPVAGDVAATLFAVGLLGAAVLAAAILPLSTAYSICEFAGLDAALDDRFADARTFYVSIGVVTALATAIVLVPGAPLVSILVGTQALNAVLLVPLLVLMVIMGRDPVLMGRHRAGARVTAAYVGAVAAIAACVAGLVLIR